MNTELIKDLKGLPDATPRLFQIVRECITNGKLDVQLVTFKIQELEIAAKQAQAYSQSTRKAVLCLRQFLRSAT